MSRNNILEYRGYHTKVEFDADDMVLRGRIEGINDFVNFECEDIQNIEKEFHEAVDDYLEFCREAGKEPDKEYKGTFNVRISPHLHKKLADTAIKNGDTLNASVEKAIQDYVSDKHEMKELLQNTNKILAGAIKTESKYQYDGKMLDLDSKIMPFHNSINMKYSKELMNE